jgi:FAD/FMN-containing dehydrogenase
LPPIISDEMLELYAFIPACFSIEAAKVVTADGNLVVANERENSDLLWAVRGGGPGFFGVVTEYTLRLFAAPRAITTSNYYYQRGWRLDGRLSA